MSIRHQSQNSFVPSAEQIAAAEQANAVDLSEGASGFSTATPENPLQRKVVVSIRSTLAELSRNAGLGGWQPSNEQLKAIYQQRQFTNLNGDASMQGDLKSVVLHSVGANCVMSTFPIALGARVTGVEETTFSSVGQPYSMIVMPNAHNTQPQTLQRDDVSIAYDFAKVHATPQPGATTQTRLIA